MVPSCSLSVRTSCLDAWMPGWMPGYWIPRFASPVPCTTSTSATISRYQVASSLHFPLLSMRDASSLSQWPPLAWALWLGRLWVALGREITTGPAWGLAGEVWTNRGTCQHAASHPGRPGRPARKASQEGQPCRPAMQARYRTVQLASGRY